MSGPLSGIRVLDLSSMLSGPWAADILGDQGADVVKLEARGSGDHVRSMRNQVAGMSSWFANINRSKRSLCVDLKTPQGLEIVRRLAADTDVVIQNFRPGVVERLGVDHKSLSQVNDQLIYLSISGYGDTGPYRDQRVYDPLVQAFSGLASIQGGSDAGRPRLIRTVLPDKLTSMAAAQAVCAAIVARARTGEGQHIKLSMLDTVLSFLWASDMNDYTFAEQTVEPAPSASSVDLIYATADGYVAVSTMTDREWRAFCTAMDRPDLAGDDRFRTSASRDEHIEQRLAEMQHAIQARTTESCLAILRAHDVPCSPVLSRSELLDDPQVLAASSIQINSHADLGLLRQAEPAARFGATPTESPRGAPRLGQHTREVLTEIGVSADDIDRLVADGVVSAEPVDQPLATESDQGHEEYQ